MIELEGDNKGRAAVTGGPPRGPLKRPIDLPAFPVTTTPGHLRLSNGANSQQAGGALVEHTSSVDAPSSSIRTAAGHALIESGHRTTAPDGSRPMHQSPVDNPSPTVRSQEGSGMTVSGFQLAGTEPERLDVPSPAVLATEHQGARHQGNASKGRSPARASDALWRATGRRRLTVEECAVLQDFSPEYPFQGTSTQQYRMVGNAIPFRLGLAVFRAIVVEELRQQYTIETGLATID